MVTGIGTHLIGPASMTTFVVASMVFWRGRWIGAPLHDDVVVVVPVCKVVVGVSYAM